MKTTCHLTDSIIELTLEAPAGDEVAAHHRASCPTCRSAAERARRSLDVWRADVVSPDEITAARARLAPRAPAATRARRPVWVLALALVVMSGGAMAALRRWSPTEPARTAVDDAETRPRSDALRPAAPRATAPAPESGGVEPVKEAAPDGAPATATAPAPATATASGAARAPIEALPPTSVARADEPRPSAEMPAPAASQGWREVAEAMRKGDKTAADGALGELATSKDPATRDAARLARAELAISNGRRADAQVTLTELATRGATPLVRRRAAELLAAH